MATTTITGTITLDDGTSSQFQIDCDGLYPFVWRQWGADGQRLGRTVDLVDALTEGARAWDASGR